MFANVYRPTPFTCRRRIVSVITAQIFIVIFLKCSSCAVKQCSNIDRHLCSLKNIWHYCKLFIFCIMRLSESVQWCIRCMSLTAVSAGEDDSCSHEKRKDAFYHRTESSWTARL